MTPILEGKFPFHYVLGNGPIFFYIASLFSLIVGFNFLALKVTSVVFGLLLVFGGYLFARELFNKEIALITAFLLAVSKWPVIYSRLGLMNIMIPTVISYIFYFLLLIQHPLLTRRPLLHLLLLRRNLQVYRHSKLFLVHLC